MRGPDLSGGCPEMIDLSILMVNWNTRSYLLPCLESVSKTVGKSSWEVIVVDNGSCDGSGEAVRNHFPTARLIENDRNLGFAKAMNQGLRACSGRYALLLNPDTRMKEETLERMISFMETHPDVGISGAQLLNGDGSKQNSIANFPSLVTELLNKSLLRWMFPKRFPGKESHYPEPIEVDSVIGACMMVRREAMEQVGFLDEDYFLFLEETDWCYRMKKAGWKVYHLPQVEVYHDQGKSAEREKRRAKIEYYRSRYHFFKKNRGSLQGPILVMGLIGRLLAGLIFMSVACLLTLCLIKKWRIKLSVYVYLLGWHLRFCPEEMGLREKGFSLR
jgi:GT2 family glycosyltransferase